MLEYMIEDLPEYRSRGERIMSVLNGSGSVDVLPGRPDVQASDSDLRRLRRHKVLIIKVLYATCGARQDSGQGTEGNT